MWIIQTSLNENDQLSAGELDFSHSKQSCVDVMWWNQREKTQNYWKQAKCKASKMHYDLVSWASNFGNFWVTWGSNLRILWIKIKHGSIEILHMIHDSWRWFLVSLNHLLPICSACSKLSHNLCHFCHLNPGTSWSNFTPGFSGLMDIVVNLIWVVESLSLRVTEWGAFKESKSTVMPYGTATWTTHRYSLM